MRSKADTHSDEAEKAVRDIRRATRRQYSPEEKVRIVITGLRGEYTSRRRTKTASVGRSKSTSVRDARRPTRGGLLVSPGQASEKSAGQASARVRR